jgi:hypothetical protein
MIFLDEISGTETIHIDIRVIAAMNGNLKNWSTSALAHCPREDCPNCQSSKFCPFRQKIFSKAVANASFHVLNRGTPKMGMIFRVILSLSNRESISFQNH